MTVDPPTFTKSRLKGIPLVCRRDPHNHSPDGFEVSHLGSGPTQLALAVLADAFGGSRAGDQLALAFYQDFKWRVIARLPQEAAWIMTLPAIFEEVSRIIIDELDDAAYRIRQGRDRFVTCEVNAVLDEAEERNAEIGNFDELEVRCTRQADEEFRKVLTEKLGMSPAFCSRWLGVAAAAPPTTLVEEERGSNA
jgi:hypothetical protein